MLKHLFEREPSLRDLAERDVTPLLPFIKARRRHNGELEVNDRLKAIQKGLIPNTGPWLDHFGTEGAVLLNHPRHDGRSLVLEEERDT